VCVHTFPSLGSGVRRSGSLRWLAAGTGRRVPKIGPQQVTWNAGDPGDLRHPLGRYLPPLRDGAPLDAEFTGDQGLKPPAGGGTQQLHSGEDSRHLTTLSGAKPVGKPSMFGNSQYLCRETKHGLWHTDGMTMGERIRAARVDLGLSQQAVAKALGVGRSAVNQWESDTTKPSITKRAQIAVMLNMRITDLIPGMPVDEITEAVARIVQAMPPHKQASLLAVVEAFAVATGDPPPDNPALQRTRKKQYS